MQNNMKINFFVLIAIKEYKQKPKKFMIPILTLLVIFYGLTAIETIFTKPVHTNLSTKEIIPASSKQIFRNLMMIQEQRIF